MDRDAEHLRLLAVFHYVVAGLAAVFACVPFVRFAAGILDIFWPPNTAYGTQQVFFGWVLLAVTLGLIVTGWTFSAMVAYAGRSLQRRLRYSYCLVMAFAQCLFLPLGTMLGLFTILVLSRPTVRALFGKMEAAP